MGFTCSTTVPVRSRSSLTTPRRAACGREPCAMSPMLSRLRATRNFSPGASFHPQQEPYLLQARIARLAEQVLSGTRLDRADARYLATVAGEDIYDLFYWANKIRIRHKGPDVRFCAIVAAKVGGCS